MSLASYLGSAQYGGQSVLAGGDPTAQFQDIYDQFGEFSDAQEAAAQGKSSGSSGWSGKSGLFGLMGGTLLGGLAGAFKGKSGGGGLSESQQMALMDQMLFNPSLYKQQAPYIQAQMLQHAMMPGGYLSSVNQNTNYAAQVNAMLGGQQQAQAAQLAGMGQQGLNAGAAQAAVGMNPYQTMGQIAGMGAQLGAQHQQNQFQAMQSLAQTTSDSFGAEQNALIQGIGSKQAALYELAGAKAQASATKSAGKSGAIGSAIGGAIGIAALGGI